MYDILNNGREGNNAQQRTTALPFGFAADRSRTATGFPHHRRLPAPYPTEGSRDAGAPRMGPSFNVAVDAAAHRRGNESSRSRSGSPDEARGGGFGGDSDGAGAYNSSNPNHNRDPRQQQDAPMFESNPSRTAVREARGPSSFENRSRSFRPSLGAANLPAPTSFGRYTYDDPYRGMQDQQDGNSGVSGGGVDSGGGGRLGGGSGMGPGGFRPSSRGPWQGPEGPYAAVGRGVW